MILYGLIVANVGNDLSKETHRERSCTGINSPLCSISCNNPTVFSVMLLPPAFGPEITIIDVLYVEQCLGGRWLYFLPDG